MTVAEAPPNEEALPTEPDPSTPTATQRRSITLGRWVCGAIAIAFLLAILILNDPPTGPDWIPKHGDIPTDVTTLRSIERSIEAGGLRGRVSMIWDDGLSYDREPFWDQRGQQSPYPAQVFARELSGGWSAGRLLGTGVLAAGALAMGMALTRLSRTAWVGPVAMIGMISTPVARWLADTYFTLPYDMAAGAVAIAIVALALRHRREGTRPRRVVPVLAIGGLLAPLLFTESLPFLAIAVAVAFIVLRPRPILRAWPAVMALAVGLVGGLAIRLWLASVTYGSYERMRTQLESKGQKRFSNGAPLVEHGRMWGARMVAYFPWHLAALAIVTCVALILLLRCRGVERQAGNALSVLMPIAAVGMVLWPLLARQHAYIHHSSQLHLAAPFGALIAMSAWTASLAAARLPGGSAGRRTALRALAAAGAVIGLLAGAAAFTGRGIRTGPNVTADGHERYGVMVAAAAMVEDLCEGADRKECVLVVPMLPPPYDNRLIFANATRTPLVAVRATRTGDALRMLGTEGLPGRLVVFATDDFFDGMSDDGDRIYRPITSVDRFRFWVGDAPGLAGVAASVD